MFRKCFSLEQKDAPHKAAPSAALVQLCTLTNFFFYFLLLIIIQRILMFASEIEPSSLITYSVVKCT